MISKGPKYEMFVSTVNGYKCSKRVHKVIGRVRSERHLPEIMVFAHHPVLNPNKPGKVRVCLQCSSKYKEVCLNDKVLAGPDLQHGLIGTIFRFREGQISLTDEWDWTHSSVGGTGQRVGLDNEWDWTSGTAPNEWDWTTKKSIQ